MITLAQVKQELDITNDSYNDLIEWLIESVISVWEQRTNKIWTEQTAKLVINEPAKEVFLPCNVISRIYSVALGYTSAIAISHSNSAAIPTVTITDDSLVLITNTGETILAFDDYPTLSDMATAVSGQALWSASVISGYESTLSLTLLETSGQLCETTGTDFYVPDEYATEIKYNKKLRSIAFPVIQSSPIIITYKGGYTETTAPAWLRQILIRQVCHWYSQAIEKRWHVSMMTLNDGGTISYGEQKGNLLSDFVNMVAFQKRHSI